MGHHTKKKKKSVSRHTKRKKKRSCGCRRKRHHRRPRESDENGETLQEESQAAYSNLAQTVAPGQPIAFNFTDDPDLVLQKKRVGKRLLKLGLTSPALELTAGIWTLDVTVIATADAAGPGVPTIAVAVFVDGVIYTMADGLQAQTLLESADQTCLSGSFEIELTQPSVVEIRNVSNTLLRFTNSPVNPQAVNASCLATQVEAPSTFDVGRLPTARIEYLDSSDFFTLVGPGSSTIRLTNANLNTDNPAGTLTYEFSLQGPFPNNRALAYPVWPVPVAFRIENIPETQGRNVEVSPTVILRASWGKNGAPITARLIWYKDIGKFDLKITIPDRVL